MKSYIKLLLMAGALAPMAACTDLDTDIKGQYTVLPDNDMVTYSQFEGCYYYMRKEAGLGRNYYEGSWLQADQIMAVTLNGGWWDNGRMFNNTTHQMNPDNPGIGQMSDLMSGCTYCSSIIAQFGGEDRRDPIVAPIRAARAFYEFMMMDLYGDAPIIAAEKMDDSGEVKRSPRAEVAEWIESELLDIMDDLTEENNLETYGRPNKWMAKALLAKLYLNWAVYTCGDIESYTPSMTNEKLNDCVKVCDDLMDCGVFELGQGYRKKFFPDNGVQIKDFIYAMPFDVATLGDSYEGGTQMDRFLGFAKANNCLEVGPWGFLPQKSLGGIFLLTPETVALFNLEGDERNEMILKGPQYVTDKNYNFTDTPLMYVDENGNTIQINYSVEIDEWQDFGTLDVGANSVAANIQRGCHLAKYPPEEKDFVDWNRMQSNDIPIFRLADIMLTKAECILRGANATNGDTPAGLINEVRNCSGAANMTGTATLQDVLDERGRELIAELWRRNDLIRYGKFEDDWGYKHQVNPSAKTQLFYRLYPIPTGVMDTNTNWTQNHGY